MVDPKGKSFMEQLAAAADSILDGVETLLEKAAGESNPAEKPPKVGDTLEDMFKSASFNAADEPAEKEASEEKSTAFSVEEALSDYLDGVSEKVEEAAAKAYTLGLGIFEQIKDAFKENTKEPSGEPTENTAKKTSGGTLEAINELLATLSAKGIDMEALGEKIEAATKQKEKAFDNFANLLSQTLQGLSESALSVKATEALKNPALLLGLISGKTNMRPEKVLLDYLLSAVFTKPPTQKETVVETDSENNTQELLLEILKAVKKQNKLLKRITAKKK